MSERLEEARCAAVIERAEDGLCETCGTKAAGWSHNKLGSHPHIESP